MNIKDYYDQISQLQNLSQFNQFVGKKIEDAEKVCPDIILNTVPNSTMQALLCRQLALGVPYGWTDKKLRAKWQNYWLSCCRSSKCDYFFSILKDIDKKKKDIDREKDIVELCKKEQALWEINNDENIRKNHLQLYFRFLLRRYALREAFQLGWEMKDFFLLANVLLPRLLAAIVIGLLPFLEQTIWSVVLKMPYCYYYLTSGFLVVISFLYMWYECYRVTEGSHQKSFRRASFVSVVCGFLPSFVFASIGINFMKDVYATKEMIVNVDFLHPSLLFASAALFIGIFIQVLWEEKTIAEPL